MDDMIRDIKSQNVRSKLEEINRLHPKLKFTIEMDKEINHIGTTWYIKPTDTGLIMNNHPLPPRNDTKDL